MKTFMVLILGFLFIGAGGGAWAEEAPPQALNLEAMIDQAVSNNPDVAAAKRKWEALQERPAQAAALDDPMLEVGVVNLPTNTFNFQQEDMTMKEIGVSQRVPYFGKRSLRYRIAHIEAQAAFSAYEEIKNRIARDVKTAYFELFYVNKAIQVTERSQEILKLLNQIAETKYSVGEGVHADVYKAQVELSKMLDELIVLNQNKRSVKARLNTLIYQPAFSPLGEPEDVTPKVISANTEDLVQAATQNRPLVQATKKMIERNQAGLQLAQRDYYPDFDLRVAYGQRDSGPFGPRSDMISGMVSVNLPIWYKNKQERRVVESWKEIQSAKEQLNSETNEIRFMVSDRLSEIERSAKQMELLKTGIIPQAEFSLDSAMSSYRVGKVDFIMVLDSIMTLFRYEVQYYRLLTDSRKDIAEIEALVGGSLPEEKKG